MYGDVLQEVYVKINIEKLTLYVTEKITQQNVRDQKDLSQEIGNRQKYILIWKKIIRKMQKLMKTKLQKFTEQENIKP